MILVAAPASDTLGGEREEVQGRRKNTERLTTDAVLLANRLQDTVALVNTGTAFSHLQPWGRYAEVYKEN